MKYGLLILFFAINVNIHAQTNFSAVVINNGETLSITMVDDFIPPHEAGLIWKSLKGSDQSKNILEANFRLNCMATINSSQEPWGNCKIKIPMKDFKKMGSKLVFKLEGSSAARLNSYFIDSAYVSMQRGDAYLSSYNPRRQFFFGLEENLIHR